MIFEKRLEKIKSPIAIRKMGTQKESTCTLGTFHVKEARASFRCGPDFLLAKFAHMGYIYGKNSLQGGNNMATLNISMPDEMRAFIETRVRMGACANR